MVESCYFRTKAGAATGGTNNRTVPTSRTRNLLAPRSDFRMSPAAMPKRRDRRPPLVHSRSTLKSSPSRTQQRHLEYLATSLQTLANNDWGSHRVSRSSDNEEEPGRGLVKKHERSKRCIRKYVGMALEKQQWRRCWRCCWRRRRRFPDTRDVWSVSNKGPTTRDANCDRTTRWTPPW